MPAYHGLNNHQSILFPVFQMTQTKTRHPLCNLYIPVLCKEKVGQCLKCNQNLVLIHAVMTERH